MIRGSCLCRQVQYEVENLREGIVFCHCSFCRKATASAFSANARVARDEFKLVAGEDKLATYESSSGKIRYYCSNCHSQLYHHSQAEPTVLVLKLGTIDYCDQDLATLPRKHIFNDERFPWLEC